jgi:uncharacterized membrane protein
VPHSFAISGQLFLAPPKNIERVEGKSSDIMKYIVAGGVATHKDDETNIYD